MSNTECVELTLTGTGNPYDLEADIFFDPDTDDCLNCGPDGVQLVLDPAGGLVCGLAGLGIDGGGGGDTHDGVGLNSTYTALSANSPTSAGIHSVAIGYSASSANQASIAIGSSATATGDNGIAIGNTALVDSVSAVAVGLSASVNASPYGVALGFQALLDPGADYGVAIGYQSAIESGANSIAVGSAALSTAAQAIAIGDGASALHGNSVAIGASAGTTAPNQIMLGTSAERVVVPGVLHAPLTANRQIANYILVLTDAGKVVEMNLAGVNTLTVPPNSSVAFDIGTIIEGVQWGAGQTTITPGVGVTIRSLSGALNTFGQYAQFSLRKVATDEWIAAGELS